MVNLLSPEDHATGIRSGRLRKLDHALWKWVFRAAMLSGVTTMCLTLVLVLR